MVPKFIRRPIEKNKIKSIVLNYYNSLDEKLIDEEKKEALDYLSNNELSVFPYPFQEKHVAAFAALCPASPPPIIKMSVNR